MKTSEKSPLSALIELVCCPVCGQSGHTVLRESCYDSRLSADELRRIYSASSDERLLDPLVRCHGCGLVYLNPRIRQEIILDGYRNAEDPLFIAQNEARIVTFTQSLRGIMRRHAITPHTHPEVLDIGCAGGAFPKAASDLGFQVVGLEPSVWMAAQARQRYGLDIRSGILDDADFAGRQFDLITLWDVIEHMADPVGALRIIQTLLKEHGLLIINYPDYSSITRRILGSRWPFFLSVHLYYFDPRTMTRLLQENGFAVCEIRAHWQKLALGYVLKRASAYFSLFGFFSKLLKDNRIGQYNVSYNMGQSLVVATRKVV